MKRILFFVAFRYSNHPSTEAKASRLVGLYLVTMQCFI